jgi:23S rRNA (adenine2503-C2)-methyltransferase
MARAVAGLSVQVNLMRYNPVPGAGFRRPSTVETERFRDALRKAVRVPVTIRRSRGLDIEGACGQLRLARGGSTVGEDSGG